MIDHQSYVDRVREKEHLMQEKIALMDRQEAKLLTKGMLRDINSWIKMMDCNKKNYQSMIQMNQLLAKNPKMERSVCQRFEDVLRAKIEDIIFEKQVLMLIKKQIIFNKKQNDYTQLSKFYDVFTRIMILHDSILTQVSIEMKIWDCHLNHIIYMPIESEEENITSLKSDIQQKLDGLKNDQKIKSR